MEGKERGEGGSHALTPAPQSTCSGFHQKGGGRGRGGGDEASCGSPSPKKEGGGKKGKRMPRSLFHQLKIASSAPVIIVKKKEEKERKRGEAMKSRGD